MKRELRETRENLIKNIEIELTSSECDILDGI